MFQLYFGLLVIGSAVAQIPSFGGCPDVETVSNFDVKKYLGKWYEQERFFAAFEVGAKCVTAEYSENDNGTIKVVNKQINYVTSKPSSIEGYAVQKTPGDAKLGVIFPSSPIKSEGPYWIVDTDYDSYAVVWSCSELGFASAKIAWILTRERFPVHAVIEAAYQAIDKAKINKQFFMRTDQKHCD
ncbi:hypothetical protein QAD02_000282 [Eretmocerus hayati]|uniref:Uncharacterized protein n=1 Tax=Eretmocerus hayati TaxID=131215 RepID=A0ACC2ND36_9HYME|nr:hypothetical protein QAD02_000282 [Eretmocerus hayati]